jgi:DHA1 family tetracycline resistance protein-like MFS transporter
MTPPKKSLKTIVFLIILLDVMGFGLIIPVQPFLAQEYGASATTVTWLGAIYSLTQFLFAPLWGGLSDRIGRRPVLLGSLAMTLVGHLAFALSNSLPLLFCARALAGIGAANIATAQAVISDTNDSEHRSSSMAILGAAFGLGFVFGPAIGGALSLWHPVAPALFAAALSCVNLAFVASSLPETRVAQTAIKPRSRGVLEFFSLPRDTKVLVGTTFLTITAFALMEQSLGLFIQSIWVSMSSPTRVSDSTTLNSSYLVVVGISAVFVQGFLVRKLLKRYPETAMIRLGLVTLCTTLVVIPLLGASGSFPLFLVSAFFLALGSGLFNPSMSGLISKVTSDDSQGLTLAINQSAAALGRIVGPLCAGSLFAVRGNLPFLSGAALIVVALALLSAFQAKRLQPT